ncbi:sensor histidine kinase RegB [Paenirhodobacter populi]|uniref:sensor histidine kinase RegB n=1 Tax=Paenirhodobacter populi TaxID=2306993 RepID=UPI000FE3FFD5|nr:ActS/PrrB/RegB family redox-sensitive histidine kinase [Sinirhodobacter populi]RWR11334.1 HAMP domain-containing histidine kinase [Sinirhodobacter populi]
MDEQSDRGIWSPLDHNDWIRLRTLIFLRWGAVIGQTAAVLAAWSLYDVALDLTLCLTVIGVSVLANLAARFVFPESRRVTQVEMTAMLLFDTTQLALLLSITGGLNNPFALFILVPVTIAATALERRAILFLGVCTIALISLVSGFHLPLVTHGGEVIAVPPLVELGYWLAIVIGVIFLGTYAHGIATEIRSMADALQATQMALSREQKLTDLGGVVAAAAHELGTPLATIKLVSSELADELEGDEDLHADVLLIRDQADRCRDILRSMGRAGKDDLHMRSAPLLAVLREAAEPHMDRGKLLHFDLVSGAERQPLVHRYPELIHALRNLIQNAVDFARSTVWIEAEWTAHEIIVRITDDGPGYAPGVLGRIGDPYLHRRAADRVHRPEYEGMGLGLFIAKTLLQRTGANLRFANSPVPAAEPGAPPRPSGAMVELIWPADRLLAPEGALGENRLIMP